MTEEIIIDGVDVAGCKFRLVRDNKQKCECCHATGFGVICNCESWHDCYYKQLKRLEKEVKHWQTEHREAKAKGEWTYDLVRKKADSLKQENERLTKSIERYRSANERLHDISVDDFNLTLTKYKSVLEEIKEDMEQDTTCESRECGCDDYAECLKCIKETILNKINEVLKMEGIKEVFLKNMQLVKEGKLICKQKKCRFYNDCDNYNCSYLEPVGNQTELEVRE